MFTLSNPRTARKNDQLVAYYRIEVRCRRTWMPIMLHGLDVMRTNAYIVFKHLNDGNASHKAFVVSWIQALRGRSAAAKYQHTRASQAAAEMEGPSRLKKRRISHKNPVLPDERFKCDKDVRKAVIVKAQRMCKYCSYLSIKAKKQGGADAVKVRSVTRTCSECQVHLCKDHFDVYHEQKDE